MAGIPRASYGAEIAWEQGHSGYFTIGRSRLSPPGGGGGSGIVYPGPGVFPSIGSPLGVSGYDRLAPSAYSTAFLGAYDDIAPDLSEFTVTRGRQETLLFSEAGSLTLTLRDRYDDGTGTLVQGKYNAKNTDSPLYGLIKPLRPGRITATYAGVTYGLGYGFLRDGDAMPGPRRGTANFELIDFFLWLGGEAKAGAGRPIIGATGPITTGAAIGLILDAVGWTEPGLRLLADGDVIPSFAADGSKTALELVEDLLTAERGFFFVNGSGVVRYQSRHERSLQTSQGTISDEFPAMPTGFSLDTIRTRARVLRAGGVLQEYADASAEAEFGERDFDQITTPYLANDSQAYSLAQWLVKQAKDVRPVVWSLEIEGRTPALLTQILARDVGDRVTVTESVQNTEMDAYIERVEHHVSEGGPHRCTWLLSERPVKEPFRIGVSHIGGADVLSY